MSEMTVLASGLRFPEGPVAMSDGSVVVVEIETGHIARVAPDGTVTVWLTREVGRTALPSGPTASSTCATTAGSSGRSWTV